jgi:hypothetical protein
MKRRLGWILVVVGVALFVVEAGVPADQLKGPGIIRITSRETKYAKIDINRNGTSAGDMEISRLQLYNKGVRKKPIGHAQLVCVITGDNFRNCDGTYILPAGKIAVSGALIYRGIYDLAVTGGTGLYNNVRGSVTVTRIGRQKPPQDLLVFRLVV